MIQYLIMLMTNYLGINSLTFRIQNDLEFWGSIILTLGILIFTFGIRNNLEYLGINNSNFWESIILTFRNP